MAKELVLFADDNGQHLQPVTVSGSSPSACGGLSDVGEGRYLQGGIGLQRFTKKPKDKMPRSSVSSAPSQASASLAMSRVLCSHAQEEPMQLAGCLPYLAND